MARQTPLEGLPRKLALAREQAGLTQAQVSRLMGMHRPTVSEIEAGRRRVTAQELKRFAEVYGVSVGWLTEETADPAQERVELAARELAKLKEEDLDRVLDLLTALRGARGAGE